MVNLIVLGLALVLTVVSAGNLRRARRTFDATQVLLGKVEDNLECRALLSGYPPEVRRDALDLLRLTLGPRSPIPKQER